MRWGTRLSPRPPFLETLQDTPRPYPRKVVQSSTLDRADADTRSPPSSPFPPPRSSPLRPSPCPLPLLRALLVTLFLQRLFTAAGRYISRTTKLLDLGLVISSTRYPDIRPIIGRHIELLPLLVNASEGPYFVVVDHRNVRRLILFTHRIWANDTNQLK